MPKITRFLIAVAILAASLLAAWATELEFSHFEDGSGKISWCLPAWTGAICSQGE